MSLVKNLALQYFIIQELVREGRISIHDGNIEDQIVDIGTKHLSKHGPRYPIKVVSEFQV